MHPILLEYFNDLKEYDVHCEIVPLIEKGWLTPTGGLRNNGWMMRLAFGESLKGKETIEIFKEYIMKLYEKYGKNRFKYFKKADLGVIK